MLKKLFYCEAGGHYFYKKNGDNLHYCLDNELDNDELGTTEYAKMDEIENEYCGCNG